MDRSLRIRILLEASDRVTKPLRDIAGGSSRTAQALRATRDRLREIDRAQADIASFRQLKAGLRSTAQAMVAAQARASALGRDVARAGTPTRALARDFDKARREAERLTRQHETESRELAQLRARLGAAGIATRELASHERRLRDEAARTTTELERQSTRLARLADRERRFSAAREKFASIQDRAAGIAAGGASSIGVAVALGRPIYASADAAMNLEEGMAGVAKVTGMANGPLADMQERLVTLSTRIPMTATDLSRIAASAGAAGVGMDKFGRPLRDQAAQLVEFTDGAARMGIAFDMSADDAGATMAKWRQAFQMSQPAVEALGDRVNALTNKFGGKAADVAEIVTRVGPLGKVAGIAAPQMAALGSSMNSVGVENEIAATGIKNTLLALTKGASATKRQTEAYKLLGLSAVRVGKEMQTNASGTIVDVFERIAKLAPDQQASVLGNLFGTESVSAIAPLLTNLDGLKQRLGLVGDASQYSGSMTREFLARIATTKGVVGLAANSLQAVNLALGKALLPTIRSGAVWIADWAKRTRAWVRENPLLARGLMVVAGVLAVLFATFGALAIAVAALLGPFAVLGAASTAIGIGMLPLAGIMLGVVAGIAAIAGAAYLIYANWGPISAWWTRFWKGMQADGASLVAFFSGLPGQFARIGSDLIGGLIRGVLGRLGDLKSTIVGAASAAATWFKSKLGIRSPSRVFAGFGGNIVDGLGVGIDRRAHVPVARLQRLSRNMIAAIGAGAAVPAIASGGVGGPGVAAAAASRSAPGGPVTINVYGAPGQSEQALAQEVARLFAAERAAEGARRRSSYADVPDWSDPR